MSSIYTYIQAFKHLPKSQTSVWLVLSSGSHAVELEHESNTMFIYHPAHHQQRRYYEKLWQTSVILFYSNIQRVPPSPEQAFSFLYQIKNVFILKIYIPAVWLNHSRQLTKYLQLWWKIPKIEEREIFWWACFLIEKQLLHYTLTSREWLGSHAVLVKLRN